MMIIELKKLTIPAQRYDAIYRGNMFRKYDPIILLQARLIMVAKRHSPNSMARRRAIRNEIELIKLGGDIVISDTLKNKLIDMHIVSRVIGLAPKMYC